MRLSGRKPPTHRRNERFTDTLGSLRSTVAFRVREGHHAQDPNELGPPPASAAKAGRMNPAGIPYFYLSLTQETALVESRVATGDPATVGRWETAKDFYVLDLTKWLRAPSIFSVGWGDHDLIKFIYEFVDAISEPVEHDGTEHVEYVPTQVLSEFFAQSFTYAKGRTLDGILFPSALLPNAQNLVLFPVWSYSDKPDWSMLAQLVGSQQVVAP